MVQRRGLHRHTVLLEGVYEGVSACRLFFGYLQNGNINVAERGCDIGMPNIERCVAKAGSPSPRSLREASWRPSLWVSRSPQVCLTWRLYR